MKQNLFLIGYRCTGKSTVGPKLASRLGWTFHDADVLLEEHFGQTIQQIFASEGESGFRDKESFILEQLCEQDHQVIATGGGVILREANRVRLRESGVVVWLTASPETIWERMQIDPTTGSRRPNLAQGGLAEVEELLAKRLPYYQETANYTISSEGLSPEEQLSGILEACTNLFLKTGKRSS
jgi:shikimate kinase